MLGLFLLQVLYFSTLTVPSNGEETAGFAMQEEVMLNNLEANNGTTSQLRLSTNPNDIKFYLFKNYLDEDERIELPLHDIATLYSCGYDTTLPLILLIHGVLSDSNTVHDVNAVKNMLIALRYPANIVMVDYGPLTTSDNPFIFSTLSFLTVLSDKTLTLTVSQRVTEFIQFLISQRAVSGPAGIHMIAFSVGAHMAGEVGRNIYQQNGLKIARITALDPSVQFAYKPKLLPTDATFVDVTLTSFGKLATFRTEGHVQFFINGGGPRQMSCPNFMPFTETYCSHTLAISYFIKASRKEIFGCPCRLPCKQVPPSCISKLQFGMNVPETARGNYYVKIPS